MFGARVQLSEKMQKQLGESIELTEASVTLNRKQARYLVGLMGMVADWSQFETKNNRLMTKLGVKQELVDDMMSRIGVIAKEKEEEGGEEEE